jgi:hypothetical protein
VISEPEFVILKTYISAFRELLLSENVRDKLMMCLNSQTT